jgi:hypothetical protein
MRLAPEGRQAIVLGALVLLLTSLPYIVGFAAQTPDRVFDGAVYGLSDYHSHLAKMQQGLRGEWLWRSLFTFEEQQGGLLFAFYTGLGQLARLTGLSLPLIYQLARVVCGALFLWATYRFIAAFEAPSIVRRAAFALAAFSSGLGWLTQIIAPVSPGGISPIDFWLVDANSFFSIMLYPHFSAAMALLLVMYRRLVSESTDSAYWRDAVYGFLLTLIHPYAIAIVAGPAIAFGAAQVWRRRSSKPWWARVAALCIGAAPPLIYSFVTLYGQPAFRAWTAQNVTPSPPPMYYVSGYGLVLALAVIGARRFVREQGDRARLVLIWIFFVTVLAYAPVGPQRRFIEGMHVGLCLIAAYGLWSLAERIAQRVRFVAVTLTIVLAAMSNVYMVLSYTMGASMRNAAFFHDGDVIAAIDWLGAHTRWDETALASEATGGVLAAWIGHRVVLGHPIETLEYPARVKDVAEFFGDRLNDAGRIAMLDRLGVQYVIAGDAERALGGFDPGDADYLSKVFEVGGESVYQVIR